MYMYYLMVSPQGFAMGDSEQGDPHLETNLKFYWKMNWYWTSK